MNTYIWEIESLDCVPDGKVVSCIHWRLKGDDGINTAEVYGTQNIEQNNKNSFILYEELVKNDVILWVQESMGSDEIFELKKTLDKRLENLVNPPIVSLSLPWIKNEF